MAAQVSPKPQAARPTLSRLQVMARAPILAVVMAALLFLPAGTFNWPVAWALIGFYVGSALGLAIIVPIEKELVDERTIIKDDVKSWDKPLALIVSLGPLVTLPVGGFDFRYGWQPDLPLAVQIAGLVVSTLGNALSMWAMAVNRFFSRYVRIQKERGHVVVTDGPYRFVRHPGYVGGILLNLGWGLALGSLWALIPSAIVVGLLVVRTALEDKTLQSELPGYREYTQKTRYRLLPGVW